MLTIRDEQLALLQDPRRERVMAALVEHVERFFPMRCRALGKVGVHEAVEHGVARASTHGFVTERDLCKYVDLMFVFGRDFDRDEGWVEEVLEGAAPPTSKIELLYDRAVRKARRARGIQPRAVRR